MALAPVDLNQIDNHSAPYCYELSIAAINDHSDLLNYWRIIREHNTLSVRHIFLINIFITVTYGNLILLAPQMAPHLAEKIISALARNKG